ncbi:MAG: carbohydrate binding domain-containing protein, partial [Victivallales bacterium]|nr:carbohydrate binding domain-containing protein [Victivallales bacterium]
MKKLLLCSLCLLGLAAFAQVKPGENLLVNGKFEADQEDFPPFWANQAGRYLSYNTSGGPNGIPSIKMTSPEPSNTESTFRQYDLELVAGETYRVSAWVRTKNFQSKHYGITVCNNGWFSEQGIKEFKPTQDWTLMTNEFKAEKSSNGKHMMIFFAVNFQGEVEIADVKLEAISKGALEGSHRPQISSLLLSPQLIPTAPLLNQIPLDKPELTFRYFGKLPEGTFDDYWFILGFDDNAVLRQQLQRGMNTAKLPPRAGKHHISVEILPKTAALPIWKEEFDITIVNIPKVSAEGHRRLNNLVTEILNAKLAEDASEQSFSISHTRNGWLYIAAKDTQDADISVSVDGSPVIGRDSLNNETFRELSAGSHTVTVKGATKGGRLVVRSIVDIFNYCPGANSYVGENGKYNWPLMQKFVLPAVTTLNGGSIPEENRAWLRQNGYHWLANANTTQIGKAQDLVDILKKNGGFTAPHYDGVTCDEQFFSRLSTLKYYTDGVKQFEKENPSERLIYTWIVGKPATNAVSYDFISTSVNASKSRGKLLFEIYCRTKETEEQAAAYLRD